MKTINNILESTPYHTFVIGFALGTIFFSPWFFATLLAFITGMISLFWLQRKYAPKYKGSKK